MNSLTNFLDMIDNYLKEKESSLGFCGDRDEINVPERFELIIKKEKEASYKNGYDCGYEEGRDEGFDVGYDEGFREVSD